MVLLNGVRVKPKWVHPRAAINVLARQFGARVVVVDVGIAVELPSSLPILYRKIAFGTADFAHGSAMTPEATLAAIGVGLDVIVEECERGLDVVCLGEMGIGNTTAASAIIAAITGLPVGEVTGRSTGIDDATWRSEGWRDRTCASVPTA